MFVKDLHRPLSEGTLSVCRTLSSMMNNVAWSQQQLFSPEAPSLTDLNLGQAAYRYLENSHAALDAIEKPNKFSGRRALQQLEEFSQSFYSINECLVEILPHKKNSNAKPLPVIYKKKTLQVRPHFGIYEVVKNEYRELSAAKQRDVFEMVRATYLKNLKALEIGIAAPKKFWSGKQMKELAKLARRLPRDRDLYSSVLTLLPFADQDCSLGTNLREALLGCARKLEHQLSNLNENSPDVARLSLGFDAIAKDKLGINFNLVLPDASLANIKVVLGNPNPALEMMKRWNEHSKLRSMVDWTYPPAEGRRYALHLGSIETLRVLFEQLGKITYQVIQNPELVSINFKAEHNRAIKLDRESLKGAGI